MELTKKDVISMIGLIKANYPYAYKDVEKDDLRLLQETWFRSFSKYPKEVVGAAFQKAIESCKMPPTIADVMEYINTFQTATEKNESELWAEFMVILKQVADYVYCFRFNAVQSNGLTQGQNAKNQFECIWNKLDPLLKEYCGNREALIDLSKCGLEELNYEKGRFLRIFPTLKNRAKIRADINPTILQLSNSYQQYISNEAKKLIDKM